MKAVGVPKFALFYVIISALSLALMGWQKNGALVVGCRDVQGLATQVAIGLGVGLLLVKSSRWALHRFGWARRLGEELRQLVGGLKAREAVALGLLGGVSEELLFRGVLQSALGFWLASLIFGLMHVGPNARFVPWAAMALLAGMIFGGIFWWSGGLVAPCVAHSTVNCLNLLFFSAPPRYEQLHLEPVGGQSWVEL